MSYKIATAEIVLPGGDLDETISFFSKKLGFQLESIFPADNPKEAVINGYGLRIRLKCYENIQPGIISITGKKTKTIIGPNGTEIRFQKSNETYVLPDVEQSIEISRLNQAKWKIGRAGMEYRDLILNRYGGRFIASHIRIPKAGPVADYVHFHKIRFQMIYCYKGSAKLVYENQGEPFIFQAGDCVLQPPEIRHQVLENSDQFEVIEITSPASHMTCTDPNFELPNLVTDRKQTFCDQNFIFNKAENTSWNDWRSPGFIMRDIGIAEATHGLVQVQVVKPSLFKTSFTQKHETEFHFIFLLNGSMKILLDGDSSYNLKSGDSITIPSKKEFSITQCTNQTQFLEILFL